MNILHYFKNPKQLFPRIKYYVWEKLNPEKPWLCKEAVEFCDANLRDDMIGIEFGSGRSTIWFAKKISCLISIEHDTSWYSKIAQIIADKNLKNIDYKLIPLNHPENDKERDYHVAPDYVAVLNDYSDKFFDFIVVDGHYRTNVIRASTNKIKTGGLFLVDDVNFWGDYDNVPVPNEWQCVSKSTNGIKKTGIWMVK
jgi:hypothetical protein